MKHFRILTREPVAYANNASSRDFSQTGDRERLT
jgi:hypothetical protein